MKLKKYSAWAWAKNKYKSMWTLCCAKNQQCFSRQGSNPLKESSSKIWRHHELKLIAWNAWSQIKETHPYAHKTWLSTKLNFTWSTFVTCLPRRFQWIYLLLQKLGVSYFLCSDVYMSKVSVDFNYLVSVSENIARIANAVQCHS